jgi:hypothetical protein
MAILGITFNHGNPRNHISFRNFVKQVAGIHQIFELIRHDDEFVPGEAIQELKSRNLYDPYNCNLSTLVFTNDKFYFKRLRSI